MAKRPARKVFLVGFPKDRRDELDAWLRETRGAYIYKHWESGSSYGNKDIPTSCDVAIVATVHGAHPTAVCRDLKKEGIPFVLAQFSRTGPWVDLLDNYLPPTEEEIEEAPPPEEEVEEEAAAQEPE